MTTYSMPSGLAIRRVRFGLQTNTQVFISPLSNDTQRSALPGARWIATYELVPDTRDQMAEVQAFLTKLRGGEHTFYGYDPAATSPRGVGTGTPKVNGASQSGTSLVTDGWTPNQTGILKAGDYFTVNDELKMITADVNSDGGGNATLVFSPSLRDSPDDNADLTVADATCVMRLIDDSQAEWSVEVDGFYSITFSGIETFF